MKKLLPIAVILLLLLTGCQITEKSKIQPLPTSFSAEVEIKSNTGNYKALLEHTDVRTRLVYSEPALLKGLTLTKTANGCTAELLGLSVSADEKYFSQHSAIILTDSVLKALLYSDGEGLETEEFDERIIIKGTLDGIPFEVTRYKAEPVIISISIPSLSFTVNFK